MIQLANKTIDKSLKLARICFPSNLIIEIFKEITGDYALDSFLALHSLEEKYSDSPPLNKNKLPLNCIQEMCTYFYEKNNEFFLYFKLISKYCIENRILSTNILDEYICKINAILIKDANIQIEDYKIRKLVPNKAKRNIFLSINITKDIHAYVSEALD